MRLSERTLAVFKLDFASGLWTKLVRVGVAALVAMSQTVANANIEQDFGGSSPSAESLRQSGSSIPPQSSGAGNQLLQGLAQSAVAQALDSARKERDETVQALEGLAQSLRRFEGALDKRLSERSKENANWVGGAAPVVTALQIATNLGLWVMKIPALKRNLKDVESVGKLAHLMNSLGLVSGGVATIDSAKDEIERGQLQRQLISVVDQMQVWMQSRFIDGYRYQQIDLESKLKVLRERVVKMGSLSGDDLLAVQLLAGGTFLQMVAGVGSVSAQASPFGKVSFGVGSLLSTAGALLYVRDHATLNTRLVQTLTSTMRLRHSVEDLIEEMKRVRY